MRRLLLIPASAVLLALPILAACSDDDAESTPTPQATVTAPATASQAPSTASPVTSSTTTSVPPSTTPVADGTIDPLGSGQQTPWTVKSDPDPTTGVVVLKDVRMGVHPEEGGWERIVFEFEGDVRPAATIQYVDKASQCASGQDVTVDGAAILEVAITGADAHDTSGATVPTTIDGPGTAITGGVQSCDFEAHVTWDFGLDAKHNFKVTTLTEPTRIVIDVKQ